MANQEASKTLKLTVKQAKFVKAKAEGKTGVAAAQEAYGTTSYTVANAIAHENLNKPSIQQALNAEFERQGITLERIVRPINKALDAQKVVIVGKDDDAFADVQDDYAIQLKASSMAAQFMGIGKQTEQGTTNINFVNVASEHKDKFGL